MYPNRLAERWYFLGPQKLVPETFISFTTPATFCETKSESWTPPGCDKCCIWKLWLAWMKWSLYPKLKRSAQAGLALTASTLWSEVLDNLWWVTLIFAVWKSYIASYFYGQLHTTGSTRAIGKNISSLRIDTAKAIVMPFLLVYLFCWEIEM